LKEIQLTQGKVTLVDDGDYVQLNSFKWYARCDGHNWYAERHTSRINGKRINIKMHRIIMNAPEGIQVDHRNGDGLYNLRENLRLATNQQNSRNRKKHHKNNKLGIKGVHWNKRDNRFCAQISVDGKIIHLGLFTNLLAAEIAYRKAEVKHFKEFARQ